MKTFLATLMMLTVLAAGCGPLHKLTHKQQAIDKTKANMTLNADQRFSEIGQLSYGVDYSLCRSNVRAAIELNDRIGSLSTAPTVTQQNDMKKIVDSLNVSNMTLLQKKDAEIAKIQKEKTDLQTTLDKQTADLQKTAKAQAAELDSYKAYWGLGGLWISFKKAIYVLLGVLVLFVGLRIGSIFVPEIGIGLSIFEKGGSWVIKGIEYLVPKAISLCGYVKQEVETVIQKVEGK